MENPNFLWVNPLFLWPFSIVKLPEGNWEVKLVEIPHSDTQAFDERS